MIDEHSLLAKSLCISPTAFALPARLKRKSITAAWRFSGPDKGGSERLEIQLAQQPGDFVIGAIQDVYSVNPYRFCAQVEQQVANLPE